MVGVYCGGVYGGSRTAILLNIPGAPAAIATAFDGFPLAKRGEAGQAIGLSTIISVLGGFIGIAVLALLAPVVADFSLKFAPRDYLLLATMGLLLVGSLSGESTAKGVFCGALGVILGMVGMDPLTAEGRFTFGSVSLLGGIHYVIAMIGLFGVSEALFQLHQVRLKPVKQDVSRIIPPWSILLKYLPMSIRTSFIGVFIGSLPGTGGDIAALLAYDHAKRTVKNPSRPFGKGAYEGLIAPESANNAAIGGAYIPMLTLGIPGDAVTAIIIGALYIHGLKPGPMLMIETPHLFWFTVGNLALSNIFLLIFGLTGIRIFAKMVELPKGNIASGDHRALGGGHLRHPEQRGGRVLDARLWHRRLSAQDVRIPGGTHYFGGDPGAFDGRQLPAGHDDRAQRRGGLFHGDVHKPGLLRFEHRGDSHDSEPNAPVAQAHGADT